MEIRKFLDKSHFHFSTNVRQVFLPVFSRTLVCQPRAETDPKVASRGTNVGSTGCPYRPRLLFPQYLLLLVFLSQSKGLQWLNLILAIFFDLHTAGFLPHAMVAILKLGKCKF